MFGLIIAVLGIGGLIGEILNTKDKRNYPSIPEDRIEKMERQLDQLHREAREQLRRMR